MPESRTVSYTILARAQGTQEIKEMGTELGRITSLLSGLKAASSNSLGLGADAQRQIASVRELRQEIQTLQRTASKTVKLSADVSQIKAAETALKNISKLGVLTLKLTISGDAALQTYINRLQTQLTSLKASMNLVVTVQGNVAATLITPLTNQIAHLETLITQLRALGGSGGGGGGGGRGPALSAGVRNTLSEIERLNNLFARGQISAANMEQALTAMQGRLQAAATTAGRGSDEFGQIDRQMTKVAQTLKNIGVGESITKIRTDAASLRTAFDAATGGISRNSQQFKDATAAYQQGSAQIEARLQAMASSGKLTVQQLGEVNRMLGTLAREQGTLSGGINHLGMSGNVLNALGAANPILMQMGGNLGAAASQATMLGSSLIQLAKTNGPAVAALGGLAIAAAGTAVMFTKLSSVGLDELKKLQKGMNVLQANGVTDLKGVEAQIGSLQTKLGRVGETFTKGTLAMASADIVKAGVSVNDALTLMTSSTRLAAAEGINLGDASNLLLKNVRQYGLAIGDAAKVGDMLAKAGNLAAGSANDLSVGLGIVGGTGKAAKIEMYDLLGMLVELDNKGMAAADVGANGLRSALASLSDISEKGKATLRGLGIEIDDSVTGKARPAGDIMKDLGEKMRGMGIEVDKSTGTLSGNGEALRTVSSIMDNRAAAAVINLTGEWKTYGQEVKDSQDYLKKYSDIMQQGLGPAMDRAQNAFQDAGLALVKHFATPLTDFFNKTLTPMVKEFGDFLGLLDKAKNTQELQISLKIKAGDSNTEKFLKFFGGSFAGLGAAKDALFPTTMSDQGRAEALQSRLTGLGVLQAKTGEEKLKQYFAILQKLDMYEAMLTKKLAQVNATPLNVPGPGILPFGPGGGFTPGGLSGTPSGVTVGNMNVVGAAILGTTGNLQADTVAGWCARWVRLTLDKAEPQAAKQIERFFAGDANDIKKTATDSKKLRTDLKQLQPGDVVVYDDNHVGIYVGKQMIDGKMQDAVRGNNRWGTQNGRDVVSTEKMTSLGSIAGYVRLSEVAGAAGVSASPAGGASPANARLKKDIDEARHLYAQYQAAIASMNDVWIAKAKQSMDQFKKTHKAAWDGAMKTMGSGEGVIPLTDAQIVKAQQLTAALKKAQYALKANPKDLGLTKNLDAATQAMEKWSKASEANARALAAVGGSQGGLTDKAEQDRLTKAQQTAALIKSTQAALDSADTQLVQTRLEKAKASLSAQLEAEKGNAAARLNTQRNLGKQVLEMDDALALQLRNKAQSKANEDAKSQVAALNKQYGGAKNVPQNLSGQVEQTRLKLRADAEISYQNRVSTNAQEQRRAVSVAQNAVYAKDKQLADQRLATQKQVAAQLSGLDAAAQQARVKTEEDALRTLTNSQSAQLSSDKLTAAERLVVITKMSAVIQAQALKVAETQKQAAYAAAEATKKSALDGIPKGASVSDAASIAKQAGAQLIADKKAADRAYLTAASEAQQTTIVALQAANKANLDAQKVVAKVQLDADRALAAGRFDLAKSASERVLSLYALEASQVGTGADEKLAFETRWQQKRLDALNTNSSAAAGLEKKRLEEERNTAVNAEGLTQKAKTDLWNQYTQKIKAVDSSLATTLLANAQTVTDGVNAAQKTVTDNANKEAEATYAAWKKGVFDQLDAYSEKELIQLYSDAAATHDLELATKVLAEIDKKTSERQANEFLKTLVGSPEDQAGQITEYLAGVGRLLSPAVQAMLTQQRDQLVGNFKSTDPYGPGYIPGANGFQNQKSSGAASQFLDAQTQGEALASRLSGANAEELRSALDEAARYMADDSRWGVVGDSLKKSIQDGLTGAEERYQTWLDSLKTDTAAAVKAGLIPDQNRGFTNSGDASPLLSVLDATQKVQNAGATRGANGFFIKPDPVGLQAAIAEAQHMLDTGLADKLPASIKTGLQTAISQGEDYLKILGGLVADEVSGGVIDGWQHARKGVQKLPENTFGQLSGTIFSNADQLKVDPAMVQTFTAGMQQARAESRLTDVQLQTLLALIGDITATAPEIKSWGEEAFSGWNDKLTTLTQGLEDGTTSQADFNKEALDAVVSLGKLADAADLHHSTDLAGYYRKAAAGLVTMIKPASDASQAVGTLAEQTGVEMTNSLLSMVDNLQQGKLAQADFNKQAMDSIVTLGKLAETQEAAGGDAKLAAYYRQLVQELKGMIVPTETLSGALATLGDEAASGTVIGLIKLQKEFDDGAISLEDFQKQALDAIPKLLALAKAADAAGRTDLGDTYREVAKELQGETAGVSAGFLKLKDDLKSLSEGYKSGSTDLLAYVEGEIQLAQQADKAAAAAARAGNPELAKNYRDQAAAIRSQLGPLGSVVEALGKFRDYAKDAQQVFSLFGQDDWAKAAGDVADGVGSTMQAVGGIGKVATGDLSGIKDIIFGALNAINSFGNAVLNLDPGFKLWKKNLLEIAAIEQKSMGTKEVGNFINPYFDQLKADIDNRTATANATVWQRIAWWAFGGAPKIVSDEAAKSLANLSGLFNDYAGALGDVFRTALGDAFTTGDWSKASANLEKSFDQKIGMLMISKLADMQMKALNLDADIKAWAEAMDAKDYGRAATINAGIKAKISGAFNSPGLQAQISTMPGSGEGNGGTNSTVTDLAETRKRDQTLADYNSETDPEKKKALKDKLLGYGPGGSNPGSASSTITLAPGKQLDWEAQFNSFRDSQNLGMTAANINLDAAKRNQDSASTIAQAAGMILLAAQGQGSRAPAGRTQF